MTTVLTLITALVLIVLAARRWLLRRVGVPRPGEVFDGVVYEVGCAAVAERRSENPRTTVIGMHGFVENMRYFTGFYRDPAIQLILLTSCDYHVPIQNPEYRPASWARIPKAVEGSIEYDADVLIQALEHLPKTDRIRVHGHSRGGAVVLEAAATRPELFARVEVILEAPVLPQARPYKAMSASQIWFLSFLLPLWRRQPINPRNRGAWGPLDNREKKELIEGLPFNPRRVSTMVANLHSMSEWMQTKTLDVYRHVRQGVVLVPEKDRVLDAGSMYASADGAASGLRVVKLEGCSHFPLFDCPESIPPL